MFGTSTSFTQDRKFMGHWQLVSLAALFGEFILAAIVAYDSDIHYFMVMTVLTVIFPFMFRRMRFVYSILLFCFTAITLGDNKPYNLMGLGVVVFVYHIAILSRMGYLTKYMANRETRMNQEMLARGTAQGIANAREKVVAITPDGPKLMTRIEAVEKGFIVQEQGTVAQPHPQVPVNVPEGYVLVPQGYTLQPAHPQMTAPVNAYATAGSPVNSSHVAGSYDYQPAEMTNTLVFPEGVEPTQHLS